MNKIKITTLLSLSLISSVFADFGTNEQINETVINGECKIQEDLSIFIFQSLFANTKNKYPVELWENQENRQINIFDLARAIKDVARFKEKIFSDSDALERSVLLERLSQMEDIADRALIMEADSWKADYVNELSKHIIGIRHAGISANFPTSIDPNNCGNWLLNIFQTSSAKYEKAKNPCDENGNPWSSMGEEFSKTPNHVVSPIEEYMKEHNADLDDVILWWYDQINGSWYQSAVAMKQFYSNQRTLDPQSYYWPTSKGKSLKDTDTSEFTKKKTFFKSFTIWHAYVQEVLSKVKFFNNDQSNKNVCLMRSISSNALNSNGITEFGKGYEMTSAVYDSYSHVNIFIPEGKGSRLSILSSRVPHHRIINLYPLTSKTGTFNAETEFIVLSGPDLPFDYQYNQANRDDLWRRIVNEEDFCNS